MKTCTKCGETKEFSEYYKMGGGRPRSACKSCVKAYREANKEAIAEQKKAYREANKEAVLEYQKAYYEANKDYYNHISAARRARKRNAVPKFLRRCETEKRRLRDIYKLRAVISRATGIEHHVDHVWPLCDGGPHWSGNLQIITATENRSKSASVCADTKRIIRASLKWAKENYIDTTNDQGGEATLERT